MSKLDDIKLSGLKLNKHRDGDVAKKQIKDLMLEMIGEDEYDGLMMTDEEFHGATARNNLKAELRTKVNAL